MSQASLAGANVDLASALTEAEARYVEANPESRRLNEAAAAAMPGGNTRTTLHYDPFPLALVEGRDARVLDADGHEYVDVLGEYTAGLYGHSNPVNVAAVKAALDGGILLGGPNAKEGALARAVVARFPAIERVRFTNSGTEANLMAISIARVVTGRDHVMVMFGGYHGGLLYFADPTMAINAPFPYVVGRYNDVAGCRALIRQHAGDLACLIVEPMLGGGGCIPATPEFVAMLREETARAGVLLIFDEVMTSRLGPAGLQGELAITPDLTTLGKYVGGGMSFGAFGGRADIMDRFDPRRADAVPHSGTFNNNVMTMSAGLAGLEEVYPPEAAGPFNARGDGLRERLNTRARAHGVPVQFRGRGSMFTVHFRAGEIADFDAVQAGRNELRPLFQLDLIARGIYIGRRGMFNLMLPLDDADFDVIEAAVDEFLASRRGLLLG